MRELRPILLVEDDARDIELDLHALKELKLVNRVIIARDGIEALDYLHRRGDFSGRPLGNPTAILLDLKMPRLNGTEVLKEIKSDERLRAIPVVMLTSSRDAKDLRECYALGVNAYVVKPIQFEEFTHAVKQLGMFWALLNEPPPEIESAEQ